MWTLIIDKYIPALWLHICSSAVYTDYLDYVYFINELSVLAYKHSMIIVRFQYNN
jgi:hypothetical protein